MTKILFFFSVGLLISGCASMSQNSKDDASGSRTPAFSMSSEQNPDALAARVTLKEQPLPSEEAFRALLTGQTWTATELCNGILYPDYSYEVKFLELSRDSKDLIRRTRDENGEEKDTVMEISPAGRIDERDFTGQACYSMKFKEPVRGDCYYVTKRTETDETVILRRTQGTDRCRLHQLVLMPKR